MIVFVFLGTTPSLSGAFLIFFSVSRRVQRSFSLIDREVKLCLPTTY